MSIPKPKQLTIAAEPGWTFEEFNRRFCGNHGKISTHGRTITESDVVQFSALTGDFNPKHLDKIHCHFHERLQSNVPIAPGMLVLSYAVGLLVQQNLLHRTVEGWRQQSFKIANPVYIGDTIYAEARISDVKNIKRMQYGKVVLEFAVWSVSPPTPNQEPETRRVGKGQLELVMRKKEAVDNLENDDDGSRATVEREAEHGQDLQSRVADVTPA